MTPLQTFHRKRCFKGCCTIFTKEKNPDEEEHDFRSKYKKLKSGVFFYNPHSRKVLLVQSRGQKWGPPKGTMETTDTTLEECAVREVLEETGLQLEVKQLQQWIKIGRATYFYIPIESYTYDIFGEVDVSGLTWISVDCLLTEIKNGFLELNSHCKKLLTKIMETTI